jgi:hypothetical protein
LLAKTCQACWRAIKKMWLCAGILCPFSRKDAKSLKWWAMWMYFWGGIGFAMGGMQVRGSAQVPLLSASIPEP